jgi:hypothetical protein
MKKTLLTLSLIFICISTIRSQDTIQVKPNSKFTYCELVGTTKLLSNKITVSIDFGQSRSILSIGNSYKDPATGKPYEFNSMIDALNFMGKEGWEFVQSYSTGDEKYGYVYHFLLKKESKQIEADAQK